MTAEQGYLGWTNRETWMVALHIGNGEGLQNYWRLKAIECEKGARTHFNVVARLWSAEKAATTTLAELLKDTIEGESPTNGMKPSMYTDLFDSVFEKVNWQEIATNLLEK